MRMFLLLIALACLSLPLHAAPPNDYSKSENWLCRPGRTDACSGTLTATVIAADGAHSQRTYQANPDAPIDCFYVYPTVSREPGANSDMAGGPEEERAAKLQFASFGRVCRLYAPLYRQVTLAGLHKDLLGDDRRSSNALAYGDVLAAWHSYLARDNHGRGVVLIGHSQGARLLTRLVAEEIDGKPEQAQLVSAILLGTDVEVPKGRSVGGYFKHVPLCESRKQTACVVAYSSYLATEPPGSDAFFGGSSQPGFMDACVNPAELTDDGTLQAEFPAIGRVAQIFGTTFMENPGLLHAKCAEAAGHSYLAISVGESPASEAVTAALVHAQANSPGWGLHALDVNLALGNLVELVGDQSKAWAPAPALSQINTLTPQEKAQGWQLLFDGTTTAGWHSTHGPDFPATGWEVKDGLLSVTEHGGEEGGNAGDILTTRKYANFELSVDFRITPGANSGIKYFVDPAFTPGHEGHGSDVGFEYQILDDALHPDAKKGRNGDRTVASLYDLIPAATSKPIRPVGEWNTALIIVRGTHGEHWLNGVKVLEYDRDTPEFRALVAASKFHVYPHFGEANDGYLLLQDHGFPVSFRNIKIRELPPTPAK